MRMFSEIFMVPFWWCLVRHLLLNYFCVIPALQSLMLALRSRRLFLVLCAYLGAQLLQGQKYK